MQYTSFIKNFISKNIDIILNIYINDKKKFYLVYVKSFERVTQTGKHWLMQANKQFFLHMHMYI